MNKTINLSLDKALTDPTAVFDHPDHVVEAGGIAEQDKLFILKRWREDVMALQRTPEDGMESRQDGLLQSVDRAIERIGPAVKR